MDETIRKAFEESQQAFAQMIAIRNEMREHFERMKATKEEVDKFYEAQIKFDRAYCSFSVAQRKVIRLIHARLNSASVKSF